MSTSPEIYENVLRSKHTLMVESAKPHFDNIDALYDRVAKILDEHGIVGAIRGLYRSFMEELYRASRTYTGETLEKKANAIASKYSVYGCDYTVMRKISRIFGIEVRPITVSVKVVVRQRLLTFGMG